MSQGPLLPFLITQNPLGQVRPPSNFQCSRQLNGFATTSTKYKSLWGNAQEAGMLSLGEEAIWEACSKGWAWGWGGAEAHRRKENEKERNGGGDQRKPLSGESNYASLPGANRGSAGGCHKVAFWVNPSSCLQVIWGLGARDDTPPRPGLVQFRMLYSAQRLRSPHIQQCSGPA